MICGNIIRPLDGVPPEPSKVFGEDIELDAEAWIDG
jgi:hypothetical protein